MVSKEYKVIAELQHMKPASKAPWVRKIGNPSSLENVVMTSYECPSSIQTFWQGGGYLNIILYCLLLKAVKIAIKYFVFHFLLTSPD